eukprot:g16419.t1
MRNSTDMAKLLLEFNANVQATDADGKTPLTFSVECGHFEFARFLLGRAGANVFVEDTRKMTALHAAIGTGSREMCGLLLAYAGIVSGASSTTSTSQHDHEDAIEKIKNAPPLMEEKVAGGGALEDAVTVAATEEAAGMLDVSDDEEEAAGGSPASTSKSSGDGRRVATAGAGGQGVVLQVEVGSSPASSSSSRRGLAGNTHQEHGTTVEEDKQAPRGREQTKIQNITSEDDEEGNDPVAAAPSSSSTKDAEYWREDLGRHAFSCGQYTLARQLLGPGAFDAKWQRLKDEKRKIQRLQDAVLECCEAGDLHGLKSLVTGTGCWEKLLEVFGAPNEEGDAPLVSAMEGNHAGVVVWLLEKCFPDLVAKADEDADSSTTWSRLLNVQEAATGETCLIKAARAGNARVVAMLIELGADAEIESETGQTALQLAQSWGQSKEILDALAGAMNSR